MNFGTWWKSKIEILFNIHPQVNISIPPLDLLENTINLIRETKIFKNYVRVEIRLCTQVPMPCIGNAVPFYYRATQYTPDLPHVKEIWNKLNVKFLSFMVN